MSSEEYREKILSTYSKKYPNTTQNLLLAKIKIKLIQLGYHEDNINWIEAYNMLSKTDNIQKKIYDELYTHLTKKTK